MWLFFLVFFYFEEPRLISALFGVHNYSLRTNIMSEAKSQTRDEKLAVRYVSLSLLRPATYNPRRWDQTAMAQLKESIRRFGVVDPIIVNCAPNRKNIIVAL